MRWVKAAHDQAGTKVLLSHWSTRWVADQARKPGDHSMPSDAEIAIWEAVLAGCHIGKQGRAGVRDQPDSHLVTGLVCQFLCSSEPMFRCRYGPAADFGTSSSEVGEHPIEVGRAAISQHGLGIGDWLLIVAEH